MTFKNYLRAGYPLLWVRTHEDVKAVREFVNDIQGDNTLGYKTYTWDVAEGCREVSFQDVLNSDGARTRELVAGDSFEGTTDDPLTWAENLEESAVFFLKDFHAFLKDDFQGTHVVRRKLRNLIPKFAAQGKMFVIVSPITTIPEELSKEITIMDYKLPNEEELREVFNRVCTDGGVDDSNRPSDVLPLVDAARGLTAFEAENAFALSLCEAGQFDSAIVRREKSAIIKKTQVLKVIDTHFNLSDLGGCANLKDFLRKHGSCFTPEARSFGIKPPRGLLLVGVPGCGKSLTAKIISTIWGRPLLQLSMGSVFDKYLGSSEGRMDLVFDMAEAIAPCVLWIDEMEKSFSGRDGNLDGGASGRVFQKFLTWFEEHTADVFVAATANAVNAMPPELLDRFDNTFWVDLPAAPQRAEIIGIHLGRIGRSTEILGESGIDTLVGISMDLNGREIEHWVQKALVNAYDVGREEITVEDFEATRGDVTPVARTMATQLERAREWARERGIKNAHDVPQSNSTQVQRRRRINR